MRLILTIALLALSAQAHAAQLLKQSTAATVKMGPFVDSTDGVTAETALTISQADVRLSKNGGDYAQKTDATAATHDEIGEYNVPLDATDTGTLGRLRVMVQETGALPVWQEFMVVPANVYDSLVLGTDTLQADTVQIEGTAASTSLASAADIVNEWETQSQADPTGFHVNVKEINSQNQATPGAAGGLFIAGTNAPVTITGAGNALTLTSTGTNGNGLELNGNGSGSGLYINSGASTADGITVSATGIGLSIAATGDGIEVGAGANALELGGTTTDLELVNDTAPSVLAVLGLATGNLDTQLAALPTAGENADAVWDEPTAGHVTGGTYGAALLSEHEDSQTLLTTANSALVTIDGIVDSVVADTNELQTDWANGGRLDLLLDTAAAGGGGGTFTPEMQTTTIATLASQTQFTLTEGSSADSSYPPGSLVFFEDASTSTLKCVGLLRSYTGSTKTVVLAADPGVFTLAEGDTVSIVYLGPPRVRGN